MSDITFRKAIHDDMNALWQLFEASCAAQTEDAPGPRWTLGVYPAKSDLEKRISEGSLYLGEEEDLVVCAFVLAEQDEPDYEGAPFELALTPDEVAVIHLLVVDPASRGKGLAKQMLAFVSKRARELGKRAIHLDVIEGNAAAEKLYSSYGYHFVTEQEMYYEDTGRISVRLFELVL